MNVSTPLYREVYKELKRQIQSGQYEPGSALPSEPKLREEFHVSIITIRRAIHELSLDGLVEPRQGVGNIVRDAAETPVVVGMSSFTTDVENGRLRLVRTLLVDDMVSASADIAEKLNVQTGSLLRHLVRLDCEGNVPLSVDEVFIPPALASDITSEIAGSPTFMHLWQQASDLELVRTNYDIWTDVPTVNDSKYLQITSDCPVLVTGELIFDSIGRPCVYIVSRYRGDRGKLTGTVVLVQKQTDRGVIGE